MANTGAHRLRTFGLLLISGSACAEWAYTSDAESVAPGGLVRAVRFGATAGGAAGACRRGLVLLPSGPAPPSAAELRVAEDSAVFVSNCYGGLRFRWLAADTLAVSYAPESMTVSRRRATGAGGRVRIVYGRQ
jgi:hypothetical protein